ncbi:MAG: oligopeptide/dipeptide ABC transporter ATP-binding protein [Rhizobiaceae bacterium]
MTKPLLQVDNLTTRFSVRSGKMFGKALTLTAVDDVSFILNAGETLGIVGESGSGKSTLGRSVLRLVEAQAGKVVWQGGDLLKLPDEAMRKARRDMQIIFQDPLASLDPRMTVADIIAEPLQIAEPNLTRTERLEEVQKIMAAVGLAPEMVNRYPHEFSGGQAQRIGIARAIITRPKLIVCDEPVSALDVSIQAQIIQLLNRLRSELGLAMIFISHDLSVVRLVCDKVMVLYLGRVVESGPAADVFSHPRHPYSQALLSAVPLPDPRLARLRQRVILQGDPPSPINPPSGCVFRTRCSFTKDICAAERPALESFAHAAACHFAGRLG